MKILLLFLTATLLAAPDHETTSDELSKAGTFVWDGEPGDRLRKPGLFDIIEKSGARRFAAPCPGSPILEDLSQRFPPNQSTWSSPFPIATFAHENTHAMNAVARMLHKYIVPNATNSFVHGFYLGGGGGTSSS